ncbi:myosin heavy chain, cardiac muscle isoform-like [Daphnia magna]|nr:myosin heavy chain, cardiac muscle isoform-like [Daphnia magna]
MNSISKNSPETALNTNPLYPDLTHQHLPSLYPTLDTLDTQDPESETQQIREQFIAHWKELVELEYEHFNEKTKPHQTISTTLNLKKIEEKQQEIHRKTNNTLQLYTHSILKKTLETPDNITPNIVTQTANTLKTEIARHGGEQSKVDDLLQQKAKSSKYTLSSSLEQLQENNNTLTKSLEKAHTRIKELENNQEKKLDATKKEVKNTSERIQQLETEIRETNKAFNETQTEKKSLRKNLTDITVKTRDIEKELLEAQAYTTKQQDKISYLESRIAEYKQREFHFLEAEGTDDSTREETVGEVTELVNQINDLTSLTGIGEKSLHFELEAEQVSELQQVIDTLKNQIELQNNDIYHLQKENSRLNQNLKMGITHDASSKTDDANGRKEDSTSSKATTDEQAMVSSLTQPIVKVLGELFSREDKKSIPPFKGKSTDKLITEWLKGAEHVARNNDWDDNQKLRFFSDRLKGEALEWHGEYSEEQGEELNYGDWREAIIERFQDAFDLATLKKKLLKLKQKPEENCRAFVSRLNSLYDSIEGKEDKLDQDKTTIVEDQLLSKVKKMRDGTKIKILLQGILPKIKAELYLRMPEDPNDFDALCKKLFISEQILQNKENNEEKEITAVIAGITHHEQQQDKELSQQKTEIEKLRQKILELECANKSRELSQENSATIAATDRYQTRGPHSNERQARSPYSRVRFQQCRDNSRESTYSRSREASFSRSRDGSPHGGNYNQTPNLREGPTSREGFTTYPDRSRQYSVRQQYQGSTNHQAYRPYHQPNAIPRYQNQPQLFRQNQANHFQPRPQQSYNNQRTPGNREIICHKCNKKGHIARECWTNMAHINRPFRRPI